MALTLRAHAETERRHDRPHRTAVGHRRPAPRPGCTGARMQTRFPKQPGGDRVLPLASPPPARGRELFSDSVQPPTIWREMMSRWMSDVPS